MTLFCIELNSTLNLLFLELLKILNFFINHKPSLVKDQIKIRSSKNQNSFFYLWDNISREFNITLLRTTHI